MIRKQLIDVLQLTETHLKEDVIMVQHPKHSDIFFILLNKKANTYTFDFVRKIHLALDKVEVNAGATSLITTSLHPSVFSGGLDLNFLTTLTDSDKLNFLLEFIRLLGRLLGFCVPTFALLNGHAIAGGCMLAFAHDWRTARAETGKVNMAMNEIEISMYLPPGMNAVCQHKLVPSVYRDMVLTAKRFDVATEGIKNGLVDLVAKEEDLVNQTVELAAKYSKFGVDKENHQKIKQEMHKTAINACLNMQMAPGVNGYYSLPKPKL